MSILIILIALMSKNLLGNSPKSISQEIIGDELKLVITYELKHYYLNITDTTYVIRVSPVKLSKKNNDTILYNNEVRISEFSNPLNKINFDTLKNYYRNPCVLDGLNMVINVGKRREVKTIQVINYYHPVISNVVGVINSMTSQKYDIFYDKKSLLEKQEGCDQEMIVE